MIYYYKSKCLAVANMTLLIRIGYYYNNLVRYQLGKQFEIVFDMALLRLNLPCFNWRCSENPAGAEKLFVSKNVIFGLMFFRYGVLNGMELDNSSLVECLSLTASHR